MADPARRHRHRRLSSDPDVGMPIDPDIGAAVDRAGIGGTGTHDQSGTRPPAELLVVGAVSAGGALGSVARFGVGQLLPVTPAGFPGTTVAINVFGCLLIGVLMVLVTERGVGHPLARPFLGTGVLGGFTTMSAYCVDLQRLLSAGDTGAAAGYLAGTLTGALAAVWVGLRLTRRLVPHR